MMNDEHILPSQCLISTMASGWWTARLWFVSRPSASPQLLRQYSVWPGFLLHQACSSPEVKIMCISMWDVSMFWGCLLPQCPYHTGLVLL